MYFNNMSRSIISNPSNLNSLVSRSKFLLQKRNLSFASYCSQDARQIVKEWKQKFIAFRKKICAMENFANPPKSAKEQTATLFHLWTRQCECVVAQRVRRGQQMFSLYSKLWEERALRAMLHRVRQQMLKHGRHMLISATGVAVFNWDKDRISDEDLIQRTADIDSIHKLTAETVKCKKSDDPDSEVNYKDPCKESPENWVPFLDRSDILVWRREESPGKYSYKLYASYEDVTAFDFLQVQIDLNYRKIWDSSVLQLKVLDSDPRSNSDLIYWESKWPRFFANRDYVFNRRFYVDQKKKIIVIISRSTTSSSIPSKASAVRVKEYWSHMVIRANSEFNKPGIEFSLTYFDDPGVQMPDVLTNWVSVSGMPDFVAKMRVASIGYKDYLSKNNLKPPIFTIEKDSDKDESEKKTTGDYFKQESELFDVKINQTCADDLDHEQDSGKSKAKDPSSSDGSAQHSTPEAEVEVFTADADILFSFLNSPMNEHEQLPKYWRYLQPLYFFY